MYEDAVLWALISLNLLLLITLWDPLSYVKIPDADVSMHVLMQNAENQIYYEIYHLDAMHGAIATCQSIVTYSKYFLFILHICPYYQRSPGRFCLIFNFKYESQYERCIAILRNVQCLV